MFDYAITPQLFRSPIEFDNILSAVNNKKITTGEVKTVINGNIINLYNSIVYHFFGGGTIDHENIYKREAVQKYITEYCSQWQHYFMILVQNGFIGVCGRGYTLDHSRLKQSEQDYEKMINVYFQKGIIF